MSSSRKIERATYEDVPFRFIAGNVHLEHDTLATFRHTFLPELKDLFVQVLLLAKAAAGVLTLGTISLDGTRGHADASRRNVVSYQRLLELEARLRSEVEELFVLSEQLEERDGPVAREKIGRREDRVVHLAQAKVVLEARVEERTAVEQAEYEARLAQREEGEHTTGQKSGGHPPAHQCQGRAPVTSTPSLIWKSRIMKGSMHAGFEQDDHVQVAVDQERLLIVGWSLSNHPHDSQEAEPTLAAIPSAIGISWAAALDAGSFGPTTLGYCWRIQNQARSEQKFTTF